MITTLAKKLLLATAVVMFAASLQAQVRVQGSPGWNARSNCAYRYFMSTKRAGDPRWKRIAGRGYPSYLTRDSGSLIQSADRYCAARGQ
jgi:hypothetical protein